MKGDLLDLFLFDDAHQIGSGELGARFFHDSADRVDEGIGSIVRRRLHKRPFPNLENSILTRRHAAFSCTLHLHVRQFSSLRASGTGP